MTSSLILSSIFLVIFSSVFIFFFFNDTATTEIYTLSLHDALPIWGFARRPLAAPALAGFDQGQRADLDRNRQGRSEEHTSELQSRVDLVCRLLLEKKKKKKKMNGYETKNETAG